jgi:ribosomal-protein-alanine N-acetyltransferase
VVWQVFLMSAASTGKKKRGKANAKGKGSVRHADPTDFDGIMHIENTCFPGELAYSRDQMRHLVYRANGITLVEDSDDSLRGYLTMLMRRNSNTACLETIGVMPDCQGEGVGTRLLTVAEEKLLEMGIRRFRLEVSAGNDAAISMYQKAGYNITDIIPEYYMHDHHGTKTAFRMEKILD